MYHGEATQPPQYRTPSLTVQAMSVGGRFSLPCPVAVLHKRLRPSDQRIQLVGYGGGGHFLILGYIMWTLLQEKGYILGPIFERANKDFPWKGSYSLLNYLFI